MFDGSFFHVDTALKQHRLAQVLLLGCLCRSRQLLPHVIELRGNMPKSAAEQLTSLWTYLKVKTISAKLLNFITKLLNLITKLLNPFTELLNPIAK